MYPLKWNHAVSVRNKMFLLKKTMLLITELPCNWWPAKLKQGSELVPNNSANGGVVHCSGGAASYAHISVFTDV